MDEFYKALGTILAAMLTALAVQLYRYLTERLHIARNEKTEAEIKSAIENGVLRAADQMRHITNAGLSKQRLAIDTAKSLAPKAFGSLPADQQAVLAQATYAKLRPSLATPSSPPPMGSLVPLSLPPGATLQVIATDAIPAAPKLPTVEGS